MLPLIFLFIHRLWILVRTAFSEAVTMNTHMLFLSSLHKLLHYWRKFKLLSSKHSVHIKFQKLLSQKARNKVLNLHRRQQPEHSRRPVRKTKRIHYQINRHQDNQTH